MNQKNESPIIVWFRQDLRLEDNPALTRGCETGRPIILLYILDDENAKKWKMGGASRWWLHHSLASLSESLEKRGAKLTLMRGDPLEILPRLVRKHDAAGVYWNRCYEPYAIQRDKKLKASLPNCESFNASLLFEPWEIVNKQNESFKVYTPFWKKCLEIDSIKDPLPAPKKIEAKKIESESLDSWKLLPRHPDWAKGFAKVWDVGEEAASAKLKRFIDQKMDAYGQARDLPALDGTSTLSPHLHFGEIGPRQIWHAAKKHKQSAKFISEIGWREFAYHQLYHFPKLPEDPWREEFSKFPWEKNEKLLKKWEKGETGYPIVDAGMRQLWETGWMHNRVRMIVASFLIKDLFLPWQEGEKWFWDTLVDADLANNSASWQWVAGCGFDAAPFFRVFNPTLQGVKFDPEGVYIKRWVPELARVAKQHIHEPWKAGESLDYPKPAVDHDEARLKALAAFKKVKK